MKFGAILAGGSGTRMSAHNIPKQFIELCGKPIIIHTIETMLKVGDFDYLYIAIHPNYKNYLLEILEKFNLKDNPKIVIVNGGKERIDSIQNVIDGLLEKSNNPDDVVVLHDAVRPFVTEKILRDSILTAEKDGICVAVVPAVDTMYVLNEEGKIVGMPSRQTLFNGQAPDSFKVQILKDSLDRLTENERKTLTGTVQICSVKGYPVSTIQGSYQNIKITTENDLTIAKAIFEKRENESLCFNK